MNLQGDANSRSDAGTGNGTGAGAGAGVDGGETGGLLAALQREVGAVDPADPDAAVVLADLLITRALHYRASDIHLHPLAEGALTRFRIDGRVHLAARIPAALASPVITRLKVMAKLVVFQRALPQDGRIQWQPGSASAPEKKPASATPVAGSAAAADRPITLRVAFLPTLHGEDVVVRLPESTRGEALRLDALGMDDTTLRRTRSLLDLDQGTFLLTGPGGSGKTTTIYALLRAIHEKRGHSSHILTLEDPIEQDLEFAGQVPIRPDQGLDWATALRSVLRHDPNVILIGEIRDRETAEIAVHAGLTGHLVISTVHSGRAVGVLTRLLHMDIEPFLVASSVTCAMAQRLVRRLCPACRREVRPDAELLRRLALAESGDTVFYAADGCAQCDSTGGRGRVGLFELLVLDAPFREAVMTRAPESRLQALAFPNGDPLLADATQKARAGLIGVEDLRRIAASAG